ncbi:hypothetical protein HMPREF0307_01062 [Corynebacterium sp. DNF00584]|nr:hypothetical protein HMPREF0307_01062 [Corynebacterium sp. DNF00584]
MNIANFVAFTFAAPLSDAPSPHRVLSTAITESGVDNENFP